MSRLGRPYQTWCGSHHAHGWDWLLPSLGVGWDK